MGGLNDGVYQKHGKTPTPKQGSFFENYTSQALKENITAEELQIQASSSSSSSSSNCSIKPEVCLENRDEYRGPSKMLKRYNQSAYENIAPHADTKMEVNLQPSMSTTPLLPQQTNWLHYQCQQQHMGLLGSRIPELGSAMLDTVYNDIPIVPLTVFRPNSSDSNKILEVKKQDENAEERRQKRMIKNRESAARSRQRKQEYVNRLENELSELKHESEKLSVYFNKFENQIRTIQNQLSELKVENVVLKKQMDNLENHVNPFKDPVRELKDENVWLKTQTVKLDNQV